jgi:hypothetical protein
MLPIGMSVFHDLDVVFHRSGDPVARSDKSRLCHASLKIRYLPVSQALRTGNVG